MMHIRLERDSSTFERMPKRTGAARVVILGPFEMVQVGGDSVCVFPYTDVPFHLLERCDGEWRVKPRSELALGCMSAVDRKHPFSDVVIY